VILNDSATGRVVEANSAAALLHGYSRAAFLGLHPTVYIHPDSLVGFQQQLQAAQSGTVFEGLVSHLRQDGTPFSAEVRIQPFLYHDRPCLLSVVRDVSGRVRAEHLLQQQVAAHAREQATLLAVSQTLAAALELQPRLILDQLRELIDFTQAALFVRDATGLVALAVCGPAPLEAALPTGTRLDDLVAVAALLDEHQPLRVSSIASSDPSARSLQLLLHGPAAALVGGMHATLWIPLVANGQVMGGIFAAQAGEDRFTAHHADLALTVAHQAAITLVNTALHQQAQTLAVLEERQRLAQDLHDAVNQALFSAGLIAEVLPRLWEQDPAAGLRSLEDLRRLTRGAAAEMRGLLAALRPSALSDATLEDLLRQLANALMGRTELAVTVAIAGQGALPATVQVMFYRVCQEALNNVARHAAAREVAIYLHYAPDAVTLQIQDDGPGFDAASVPPGHYGLSGMRERAESVGAELAVTSQPGHGTQITARWRGAA
jgi:PAS domain S-box-containing protein